MNDSTRNGYIQFALNYHTHTHTHTLIYIYTHSYYRHVRAHIHVIKKKHKDTYKEHNVVQVTVRAIELRNYNIICVREACVYLEKSRVNISFRSRRCYSLKKENW